MSAQKLAAGFAHADVAVCKPKALRAGGRVATIAPSSPADEKRIVAGLAELRRLGFAIEDKSARTNDGYFAGTIDARGKELIERIADKRTEALIAIRGGYGSNYLLSEKLAGELGHTKVIVGFSDLTSVQNYLWQKLRWVTFYGPMIAAGFDAGAGAPGGYEEDSFRNCVSGEEQGWRIPLRGDTISAGEAEGRLLGGCLALLQTGIGTPWELDTRDAILILEDRGIKPWQIDRGLMHLKQAGKLDGVRGIVLGDFPESESSVPGSPTTRDVCARILGGMEIPVVFGAAIGHTARPMLTIPLGVRAKLVASGAGELEILETTVVK